jgi:serine/threonine-protein kinase
MTSSLRDHFDTLTPCETPARGGERFTPSAPPPFVGDYRLLTPLASGGMGELFIACRRGVVVDELVPLGELVVIKRMLPHLAKDEHLATMFRDEAMLASQLRHPNVCRVLEVGCARDGWFIAMEYLHGSPLSRLLRHLSRRRALLDLRAVIGLTIQACAGLHFAHDARGADGKPLGIVHRDVSPPNILLTTDGTVKLLDFGIAKAAGASIKTRTGTLKGKNAYMAPEQITGATIDRRTDVFALGIVLYELLTGCRLFQRDNDFLTFKAITEEPLPRARDHRPGLPAAIVDALERALARNPNDRFASAAELAAALEVASLRIGGPATADELGWSLDQEFGDEMGERDAVLNQARRATLRRERSAAVGTPAPQPPVEAPVAEDRTEKDVVGWLPSTSWVPARAWHAGVEPMFTDPGRPCSTHTPYTATPAWFVISEPEIDREVFFPTRGRDSGARKALKRLGVGAGVTGLIAGVLALRPLIGAEPACPPTAVEPAVVPARSERMAVPITNGGPVAPIAAPSVAAPAPAAKATNLEEHPPIATSGGRRVVEAVAREARPRRAVARRARDRERDRQPAPAATKAAEPAKLVDTLAPSPILAEPVPAPSAMTVESAPPAPVTPAPATDEAPPAPATDEASPAPATDEASVAPPSDEAPAAADAPDASSSPSPSPSPPPPPSPSPSPSPSPTPVVPSPSPSPTPIDTTPRESPASAAPAA